MSHSSQNTFLHQNFLKGKGSNKKDLMDFKQSTRNATRLNYDNLNGITHAYLTLDTT